MGHTASARLSAPLPAGKMALVLGSGMSRLTIVADDSPLQYKSRRPRLLEDGWEICADPIEGEVVGDKREAAIVDFPATDDEATTKACRSQSEDPPWLVVTVHKESRLLHYESHYQPRSARKPELAPALRAAVHRIESFQAKKVVPLVSQLSLIENQSRDFYEVDVPDAIAIAVHNYRQRLKQDILDELVELRDSPPLQ